MLTSSTGAQTAPTSGTYQYDPYGNLIGAGPSTFGYRSGQILPDGLIHYGARYYDPINTSWTQQDPLNQIGSPTQEDRFAYSGDDPMNQADPSGEISLTQLCATGAAIFCLATNSGDDIKSYATRAGEQLNSFEMRVVEFVEPTPQEEDVAEEIFEDL